MRRDQRSPGGIPPLDLARGAGVPIYYTSLFIRGVTFLLLAGGTYYCQSTEAHTTTTTATTTSYYYYYYYYTTAQIYIQEPKKEA